MHTPSPTDYVVPLPGIGDFTIARRMMADHLKINVEYSRITEGIKPSEWLDTLATCISVIKVLTVRAPDGWDIDRMDPFEAKTYQQILDLHTLIAEKEGSFRQKPTTGSASDGQGEVSKPGVVVPQ